MRTYSRRVALAKSDSVNLSTDIDVRAFLALYVGSTGDAVLVRADGSLETVTGLLAGTIYPFVGFMRINSTNTTAGGFVLLY